ncbi:MAG: hypothetical protein ACJASQ_002355 [Crocinitomicaceae bacterium]|jgi:hypothetical protein
MVSAQRAGIKVYYLENNSRFLNLDESIAMLES